jgi:hypothetical protein
MLSLDIKRYFLIERTKDITDDLPRLSDFFVLSQALTLSLSVVQEVNHFNPYEKKKSYCFLTLRSIYRKDILVPIFRKVRYRSMKND